MRFVEEGPNIPDLLLERRDQGRVVFLCGAGVSLNSGMPTFYKLTKYVVDFFDPPKGSQLEKEFRPWLEDYESGENRPKTPLDQIFHLLHQEYGREEVNALVADRLQGSETKGTMGDEHSIIARISSNQDGKPQIVTTNFDLLFENALGNNETYLFEPPAFPDISLGIPLTGITYLHGRLQPLNTSLHPYILSSADFGRAYLSEGWATNFIRSLLKSFTVVLVGYQAEDPPVKYLLQGLNHDGQSDRSNLYAFDKGEPEDIEAKWRDRGVTAIACKDYPSLWKSLEAWAYRADDPRKWRTEVIEMTLKGPRQLSAHERGQVVHLVRTTPGARLFARNDPPPPPEWLCVFDAWCRVGKESRSYGEPVNRFDPYNEYGLDDDPPRPSELNQKSILHHDHLLEWRRGDSNPTTFHKLSAGFKRLPPRLDHLSFWIAKNLDSPITAWWVARQHKLHPQFTDQLKYELSRNKYLPLEARRIWNLILEYQTNRQNPHWDYVWFDIKDRVNKEGWSPCLLRYLETETAPIFLIRPPAGLGESKPPLCSWEDVDAQDILQFEVKFPKMHGENIDVPDSVLESVFRIVELHLHHAESLLKELNVFYISNLTCYPEREVDGNFEGNDTHEFFDWFLKLFDRMVLESTKVTRGYAETWRTDEKYFFRKLILFALNHTDLYRADEVADRVLAMSQESFWDSQVRRELLFLICDRWEEFSAEKRTSLIERLLAGPDNIGYWSDEEYSKYRVVWACRYARWLTLQGKRIDDDQETKLNSMISGLTEWHDEWVSGLTHEQSGTSGWVRTDETPDEIMHLSPSAIVEHVQAKQGREFGSLTEKRPFTGLVKDYPRKALATLSYLARRDEYPQRLWSTLINDWPVDTRSRLFSVFLHRLGRLPQKVIRELSHSVGSWLEDKLALAYEFDKALAWDTFDHLVSGLASSNGTATRSAIGELRRGGKVVNRSRRTFNYAINGPLGKSMRGLHRVLNSIKLGEGEGIPEEFKSRFETLIAVPGEGRDHAICVLTYNIRWLFYLDPDWVRERLLPLFEFNHDLSEPAWNGYLSAAKIPPSEIGAILKPLLLELFSVIYEWKWEENYAKVASQIIVSLAVFRGDKPDGLNAKEARHCLRSMNDRNRQDAVFQLSRIGQEEDNAWYEYVIPFINTVWPRERALRTSSLVLSWVSLLENTDDKFPDVLSAVRRYLVPVEQESRCFYKFSMEFPGTQPLTVRFPDSVLELIDAITPNSVESVPNELSQILDLIEQTDPKLIGDRRFLKLVDLLDQT